VPVEGVAHDTGPRPDTSMERLAVLKPAFDPAGTIDGGVTAISPVGA
jgi:acetyl-CoA acetyltransferase